MKKILVVDNYDSFVYNLVHYLNAFDVQVTVQRNDELQLEKVAVYDKILLSPGPGIPSESGKLLDVVRHYATTKSILGVCLGQQAIGEAFGGELINLKEVFHGVSTTITQVVTDEKLFSGLERTFNVGRYHSWVVAQPLPEELEVTSTDANGTIMSLRHKFLDVRGIQFHPESILTPFGKKIIENWIIN